MWMMKIFVSQYDYTPNDLLYLGCNKGMNDPSNFGARSRQSVVSPPHAFTVIAASEYEESISNRTVGSTGDRFGVLNLRSAARVVRDPGSTPATFITMQHTYSATQSVDSGPLSSPTSFIDQEEHQ